MTRKKLEKTIQWALLTYGVEHTKEHVAKIADAIDMAIQMEQLDDDSRPTSDLAAKVIQPLPPSPAVTMPSSQTFQESKTPSLIVMPDSVEARETLRNREIEPSRIITPELKPREGVGGPGETIYWKYEDLSRVLHEKTPDRLRIEIEHPDRGKVPVTLERNVVVGHGFDSVQLTYRHPSAPEEFSISAVFSTYVKEIDISSALAKITRDAIARYSPRGRSLPVVRPMDTSQIAIEREFLSRAGGHDSV